MYYRNEFRSFSQKDEYVYREELIKKIKSTIDLAKRTIKSEKYGLTVQIKRAVVSILSNIAESSGRNSNQQMINFLSISKGSAFEVEAQLIIAFELNYITEAESNEALELIDHYCRMNQNFQNYLTKKNNGTK